jgi:BirA family biotin operon repressor/biotin-[acetyl-CoA-carboxylase] ligase
VNPDFIRDATLLGALFQARHQHVAPKDLAVRARLTLAEVEAGLRRITQLGYPIEFHPQGAVWLGEIGDMWSPEEVAGRTAGRGKTPGARWKPLLLDQTASTNDVAREHGRQGAASGLVVAAAHQTSGRGRHGRVWESPPGRGLYVSFLLRPELAAGETSQLSILASVAAVDAIEDMCGQRPQIKWPNDVVLGGRKLGGLLIETGMQGAVVAFAVVGIGLNVRHAVEDFSPVVRDLATSLFLATGQLYRRADVLVALIGALERRLDAPFAEAREAWTASSLTLGQRVELVTARGRRYGQAMGLDESGALLLRTEQGQVETITAGDMNVQA